ncbi:MAG: large conductance mechanosensitive channel protein MscL [Clostridia bacterium]|nr:large conductance mechanosensitive channel protein MscL [Clostridia bacterium]
MKKVASEFKKFITRGNVIDLAVGVIIGGAFTAIVTALTTNILQPLINALISVLFGDGSLAVYTVLIGSVEDLDTAIYINWGAFISAIINFFLIALVLFFIVRFINKINESKEKLASTIKRTTPDKEDRKEMKKLGIKLSSKEEVAEFMKNKLEQEKKAEEEKALKEQAELEEARKHTTEGLLEQIKELLENKK